MCYLFGSKMESRSWSATDYKFGYQGSLKDDEISGDGNSYSTHYRQLDTRLGRWFSIDPKTSSMPWASPYSSMNNNPIFLTDVLGDSSEYYSSEGALLFVSHDQLKNGVVIIPQESVHTFNASLNAAMETDNGDGSIINSNEVNQSLRSLGLTYVVGDFTKAYEDTKTKTPDTDVRKAQQKGNDVKLYAEYGSSIILKGKEARIGSILYTSKDWGHIWPEDKVASPGIVIGEFHTHPNDGKYFVTFNSGAQGDLTVYGDRVSDFDTRGNADGDYFEVILSEDKFMMHKGATEIKIDRSKMFKNVAR